MGNWGLSSNARLSGLRCFGYSAGPLGTQVSENPEVFRERGYVFRLGKTTSPEAPLRPGLKWIWWPIDVLLRWNVVTNQEDLAELIGAGGNGNG